VLIVAGPAGTVTHDGGRFHPEQQGRIFSVMDGVRDLYLDDEVEFVTTPKAELEDLARVHSPQYLSELEAFCNNGGGDIDGDTYAKSDSFTAARRAAGAGLEAIAALERRGGGVAFVPVRPPGHHATRDRAMGFCLINNLAVAAASLTAKGHRVLIVDWDVHHGNGTQAIFWDDPNVLYVSAHQWPLFPGTGRAEEIGGPDALGLTVNIPLPAGATGDVVRCALDEVAQPVIDRFSPDWVLVSCGFDAHRADPLGELALSTGDFAQMARLVRSYTPLPGRLALFLEGGYNAGALRTSTAATLGALLELPSEAEAPTSNGPGIEAVRVAKRARDQIVDAQGMAILSSGSQW
jgi:acetoin utilization deacetylase AcuC-like enzyme